MTLLTVIYESGIDGAVTDLARRLALPGWTKTIGATGSGRKGLREGTQVWPGTNNVIVAALPDARAAELVEALRALKDGYLVPPALHVFAHPVEEAL